MNDSIQRKSMLFSLIMLAGISLQMAGCATTRTLDPSQAYHYDERYDFSDKKKIVDKLTQSLLSVQQIPASARKPVIIIYKVFNETSEHINTSGITDDIRLALLKSGKFRFINKAQRNNILDETAYQAEGHVDPAMRIHTGKQLGADYILSGALRSIEKKELPHIRLTKKKMVYYSLNLELTDINTGEIVWADKVELARESSRPIIGW